LLWIYRAGGGGVGRVELITFPKNHFVTGSQVTACELSSPNSVRDPHVEIFMDLIPAVATQKQDAAHDPECSKLANFVQQVI
jgi:hypothetical protein